jgi:HSP20 family molecular chaperone IbpA
MNTLTSSQALGQLSAINAETNSVYGSVQIEHSGKDEIYNQIVDRTKEYVNWVAPVNILQGLDYMKIELTVPGITKNDCKIGCSGIFLWVKLKKFSLEKEDTFYCTFILPENLLTDQLTASYEINGKLVIMIPKQKIPNNSTRSFPSLFNVGEKVN